MGDVVLGVGICVHGEDCIRWEGALGLLLNYLVPKNGVLQGRIHLLEGKTEVAVHMELHLRLVLCHFDFHHTLQVS